MQFIEDCPRFIRSVNAVLVSGGHVLLQLPNVTRVKTVFDTPSLHKRYPDFHEEHAVRSPPRRRLKCLNLNGFEVVRITEVIKGPSVIAKQLFYYTLSIGRIVNFASCPILNWITSRDRWYRGPGNGLIVLAKKIKAVIRRQLLRERLTCRVRSDHDVSQRHLHTPPHPLLACRRRRELDRPVAARLRAGRRSPRGVLGWLCRAQDAVIGGGVSYGYDVHVGWLPPYPETTGYIITTLLNCARAGMQVTGWEPHELVVVCLSDGTVVDDGPRPESGALPGGTTHVDPTPTVFNTSNT